MVWGYRLGTEIFIIRLKDRPNDHKEEGKPHKGALKWSSDQQEIKNYQDQSSVNKNLIELLQVHSFKIPNHEVYSIGQLISV